MSEISNDSARQFVELLNRDVDPVLAYRTAFPVERDQSEKAVRSMVNKFCHNNRSAKKALLAYNTRLQSHLPEEQKEATGSIRCDWDNIEKITYVKNGISIRAESPEARDIYNMGRALMGVAVEEIEIKRQLIRRALNESPSASEFLDKRYTAFSSGAVNAIKAAVDMMTPYVRDAESDFTSKSMLAAELLKRSICEFRENPEDYQAPIPAGVEVSNVGGK